MQMMPVTGCVTGAVIAFLVICVIGPPLTYLTTDTYSVTAQGVVLFITVAGSVGCLATCLVIPRLTRRLSSRGRTVKVLKRMNLLGLVQLKLKQRLPVSLCTHERPTLRMMLYTLSSIHLRYPFQHAFHMYTCQEAIPKYSVMNSIRACTVYTAKCCFVHHAAHSSPVCIFGSCTRVLYAQIYTASLARMSCHIK